MSTITYAALAGYKKLLLGGATLVLAVGFAMVGVLSPLSPAFAAQGSGSWDVAYPTAALRFDVLATMPGAVLDRETDLVWERTVSQGAFTWFGSHDRCNRLALGGRMGWRVPTIQELTSLQDTSVTTGIRLTPGHPFILGGWTIGQHIWSATTDASITGNGWTHELSGGVFKIGKNSLAHLWCVRFRQGVDAQ